MSRPVTSEMIARAGAVLADGGWRYTRRQLYYATCAAAEEPRRSPARNQLALGVLLALVALILLPIRPAALAVGALAALSLALGGVSLRTRRHAAGRLLAVSYPEFEAVLRSEAAPAGLVVESAAEDGGAAAHRTPVATIVCDTDANRDAVAANLDHAGVQPMSAITANGADFTGTTVVALHDASPRGCALPLQLVDAGARVVDAGLRPSWMDRDDVQVLEGAPARMPRDLSSLLTVDESDWLRSGRRVELAVLTPERLMRLVTEAAARATAVASDERAIAGVAETLASLP